MTKKQQIPSRIEKQRAASPQTHASSDKLAKTGRKSDAELTDHDLDAVDGGGGENPTTIGSATGGAGAGKIKFNEF